jgi:DNA replication protein DnaC
MTPIHKIWKDLKFVSDCSSLSEEDIKIILPVLKEEASAREIKRIRYLLQRSGIKRVKRLEDFDWKFNPKLPHGEIMELGKSSWDTDVRNAVLMGPSGVGKSHLAAAVCYQAIQKGIPTAFITCFDLVNKLKRSANKPTMMDYYSNVKLLCLDELGYVFPAQEQQMISFR